MIPCKIKIPKLFKQECDYLFVITMEDLTVTNLTEEEAKEFLKNENSKKSLIDKRKERYIVVKETTFWKKTEIAVLAYFIKYKNTPTTYLEISRAYMTSNSGDYQRACKSLEKRGYLEKLEDGSFKVRNESWEIVKSGKEVVERSLPYFQYYLKKLKKRKKI